MDSLPRICGPKLSICGTILGVWGIVMLALMGIFLRIHSPAFFEDLPIDVTEWAKDNYSKDYIYSKYDQASINCFIAAGIYVGIFLFSLCQQRVNARATYETR